MDSFQSDSAILDFSVLSDSQDLVIDLSEVDLLLSLYSAPLYDRALKAIDVVKADVRSRVAYWEPDTGLAGIEYEDGFKICYWAFEGRFIVVDIDTAFTPGPGDAKSASFVRRDGLVLLFRLVEKGEGPSASIGGGDGGARVLPLHGWIDGHCFARTFLVAALGMTLGEATAGATVARLSESHVAIGFRDDERKSRQARADWIATNGHLDMFDLFIITSESRPFADCFDHDRNHGRGRVFFGTPAETVGYAIAITDKSLLSRDWHGSGGALVDRPAFGRLLPHDGICGTMTGMAPDGARPHLGLHQATSGTSRLSGLMANERTGGPRADGTPLLH